MKHFSLSLLLCCLCLFTASSLQAQKSNPTVDPFCATPTLREKEHQELEKQIDFAFRLKKASGAITGITHIPIRPHIVRRSDGTGGLSLSRLNNILALANSYYLSNGSGLQFYFCGTTPDYIDSDAFYANFNDANENSLANGRDVTNALNMYFVPSNDEGWAGYAYFPANSLSSTRQLILSTLTDDRLGLRTIPHELGHAFALFHTFGNSNGTTLTDELVTRGTGANCSTAGDRICDTPADPYTSTTNSVVQNLSAPGCLSYVGTARDANNELYLPSLTNLMSYYFPCYYEFTTGQYERIQAGLAARQLHNAYTLTCTPVSVNAPAGLVATIGQTKNVSLAWQDNATNEMGYFIERATSTDGPFI